MKLILWSLFLFAVYFSLPQADGRRVGRVRRQENPGQQSGCLHSDKKQLCVVRAEGRNANVLEICDPKNTGSGDGTEVVIECKGTKHTESNKPVCRKCCLTVDTSNIMDKCDLNIGAEDPLSKYLPHVEKDGKVWKVCPVAANTKFVVP